MTTIDTHASGAEQPLGTGLASIADWVTTTDHKRIGRLYLGVAALAAVASLAIAGLLSLERVDIDTVLVDGGSLTQLFALQRFGLLYLVLAPMVVGIAVAVVPLQVGARSIAFPRLAAAGFWSWLLGGGLAVYSIVMNGGPNGGERRFVDLFLLSTILALAGLLASLGSVAVTVITARAPGMSMRRMPYLAWSSLVAGVALTVGVPVLTGVLAYLYVAHHYPAVGGQLSSNYAFSEWAGFGFTQPFTLVFLLPVLGLVADVVSTATRRRIGQRGPLQAALGLVGLAFVAAAIQGTAGLSPAFRDLAAGDKFEELVPFGIAVALPALGVFLATALVLENLRHKPKLLGGLVFAVPAALLALLGAAATVLGAVGDAGLAGTVFEEGTVFALAAAGILAGIAALVHWAPKWTGRTVAVKPLVPLALGGLLAGVLGSVAPMIAGFADQPGGVFPAVQGDADPIVNFQDVGGPAALWNVLALVGAALLALVLLASIAVVLRCWRSGDVAGDDPYDGLTLEWATTSPAPTHNFDDVHIVRSAEPLLDLKISNRSDA